MSVIEGIITIYIFIKFIMLKLTGEENSTKWKTFTLTKFNIASFICSNNFKVFVRLSDYYEKCVQYF